jgi:phosphatidylglycerophosphate synthase
MKLWIDGHDAPAIAVFGLSLIERHIRAAAKAGIAAQNVVVDLGPTGTLALPEDLASLVQVARRSGPVGERLAAALAEADAPMLAVAGDVVVDQRLFGELVKREGNWLARDSDVSAAPVLLRLVPGTTVIPPAGDWSALAQALLNAGIGQLRQSDFTAHIAVLRRNLPFWLYRVRDDAARRDLERFMFKATYKGSTDFFTKYIYPPAVWALVRPLAKLRVHPNTVTGISILLTFLAVPLFAWGWWFAGLACAYGMSVLDSVDGKLARLTFTDSKLGNALDHGLDIVHPPLWYLGWAFGLSHLGFLPALDAALNAPLVQAALLMIVFYVIDRLVLMVYKLRFDRGLHAHAPIDGLVRTFISRRNINLPLFTLGLILGVAQPVFLLIVAWQIATVAWHAGRVAWIIGRGEQPE